MKKLYLVIALIAVFIGGQVFGDVVTTTRKIQQQEKTKPVQTQTSKPKTLIRTNYNNSNQNNFANNIKSCKPYSESMNSDYLGMNVAYSLKIVGWVNNKCRLDFSADTKGVSSSFEQMYGIDPSNATVLAFAPKIRCEFTKQQLEYVGDSILQENERNAGASQNMLKDPNTVDLTSLGLGGMSQSDQRLMKVLMNDKACTILNMGDLNNLMQNMLQF